MRQILEDRRLEKEKKERTEVVRTFLFQSINEARIPDDQDLAALNFTNLVLLQKGIEAENPGQVMPVGGKMEEGESIIKAGLRETVEETHLRPSKRSLVEFQTVQDYSFFHSKRGNVKNRAHFLAGRLLPEPLDVAYGIDRLGDKIEKFVSLSMGQGKELFFQGEMEGASLLDSLVNETDGVRAELFYHWQRIEAQKKMEVLDDLLREKYAGSAEIKAQVKELVNDLETNGARVPEAIELWNRLINYFTVDEVRDALKHDNLKAKLENATENFDPETGQGVPTVEFILPLIMGEELDFAEKKILMANPVTAKTLRMLQELYRNPREELLGLVDKSYRMERGGLVEEDVDFEKLGQMIDRFFNQAEVEAGTKFWDEMDEIKNADINVLFGYASGRLTSGRFTSERDIRVLKWEAQRKLIMITLLNEVLKYHNEILRRGIEPIEEIENGLLRKIQGFLPSLVIGSGVYKNVTFNSRTKSRRSQFRKMIVRDQVPNDPNYRNDTFAGTIVFSDVQPVDLIIKKRVVPEGCSLKDAQGNELKSYLAPKVIADLMLGFWVRGEGKVEIVDYKELPPQGEGMKSSGPGGKENLRFAKFYVKHTDDQGIIRYKEYHIFIPDKGKGGRGKSALDEYLDKKDDDREYAMRRLFSTKGLRSLIELLFPAEVYGEDIKHIVKGKTS